MWDDAPTRPILRMKTNDTVCSSGHDKHQSCAHRHPVVDRNVYTYNQDVLISENRRTIVS